MRGRCIDLKIKEGKALKTGFVSWSSLIKDWKGLGRLPVNLHQLCSAKRILRDYCNISQ